MKSINAKFIKIYTVLIILISEVVFELGYCNNVFLNSIINKSGEIYYNFSLCRIVVYFIFIILYLVFNKKFVDNAVEVSKNKYKRVYIYIASIAAIIITLIAIVVCINKPELFRGITIGILTVLMGNLFIIYISNDSVKNIIVTLCTLGIIFSITTEFNHTIDEKKHFMSAFNLSFLNFNYANKPITDKKIEELPQLSKFETIDPFLKEKYVPNITEDVNFDDVPSTPSAYSFVLYIPSAIGITVARLLGGSIIDLYILGRIFNLIAYGILTCIALKIIPYKKNIFTVVFLMPMTLLLAATYSVDGMCIGFTSIFIAYCLKIYKENDVVTLKQFFILIGLFLMVLLGKSMAYIAIGLIIFILPLKNTLKKNKKYLPIIIAITIVAIIAVVILAFYIAKTKLSGGDARGTGEISSGAQINFMLNNPLACIKLGINHIQDTLLNYYWWDMLHHKVFFTDGSKFVALPLLLFVLLVSFTEDDKNFKIKEKIIFILSFLATMVVTTLPLYLTYTQVGAMHVAGYQTRYILPTLPLVLMCLSNSKLKTMDTKNRVMNIAIVYGTFIIIGLAQLILV